ncbi:YigZ family protein [Pedobacter frigiditerrae]|uniref:YigZ family protein n=1 Tax=Pedobacter frigiditerrae TaxID=2530452 RepID=A0A4R0MVL6_9SPHI|nr:YigZ family protein [Pedobacter frigiditerrae]TCC90242.1 YigZ family protein [Pedobacter frigiditerrae]
MLFDDTYQTILKTSEGIFRDKGSKFIAYAYSLKSETEVKEIIAKLRSEHTKARHFCWALRLTPDRNVFKLNDDGEPSGTAGRPILNTLLSADITNVLVVVVRYFGGTLLGVPGLINAYKTATVEAIKENQIVTKTVNDIYQINFDYLVMNQVMKIVKDENLEIINQEFDTNCLIKFEVRKSNLNIVLAKLEKVEGIELRYLATV